MSNSKPLLIGGTVIVLFLFLQIGLVRGETLDLADIQLIKNDIIDTKDINEKDIAIAYKGLPYKINPEKQEKIINPSTIQYEENGQTKYKIFTGYTFYEENGTYYEVEHATSTITDYDSIIKMDIGKADVFDYFKTKVALAADYYAGIGDGRVYEDDANWATLKAMVTGVVDNATPSYVRTGLGGEVYAIQRGFLPTDTSGVSLSGSEYISSASFYLYTNSVFDDLDGGKMYLCPTDQASTNEVSQGDYDSFTFTDYGNIDVSEWSASQYNTIPLNQDGIDFIDDTGFSLFGFTANWDFSNVVPDTGYTGGDFEFSDQTGTDKDPYLLLEIASTTPEGTGTSSTIVMDEPWYSDDLTIIKGKTEIFTDSTTTPSEIRYHYYHLPFLGWAIIAVAFIIIGNRVLLEFIIRFRK